MKKRPIGLLVAAALCVCPAAALAQTADEPEAAADGEEVAGDEVPDGEIPDGEIPGEEDLGGTGLGDICQIDPEACPNLDFDKEAAKDLGEQIYAVQQLYALRVRRFEVQPYWATSLNDQFVNHPGPGLALNYYITNVLAVGANFNYYRPFNADSSFNAQVRRAARVGVPLTEYDWGAALNFTYVPAYGKFAGFGDFIFHYDAYVVGGVGAISTRPIPVIDPDNRTFDFEPKLAFNAGIGFRVFFTRWFAAILEVRDYIFSDRLENDDTAILNDPVAVQDKDRWFGDNSLTNAVQAQVGIAIFLPFSFEYRLPK
ncbi:MAG: outer membrane beta-barrel domain-containing protein [Polyangiaceae bacterium]|nr:outer membrane beta-barrel domain-containing protein [Polyangiaceae bacterium]MCW5791770.1 outer membrane beta-barrel domain-containing protein [Polyangiaceae bacterium]